MKNKFASLCVLAWNRPGMLSVCLKSLHDTLDYPAEIIVNFDADVFYNQDITISPKLYSKKIVSNGKNRGVGRSFQNCLGVAEGDYILKIDDDLIFKPHWLSTTIK